MPFINIYTKESEKENTVKTARDVKVMCGDREIEGVESVIFDEIRSGEFVMATIKCFVRLGN